MMQGIKAIAMAAMLAFHGAAGGTVYHEALTAEARLLDKSNAATIFFVFMMRPPLVCHKRRRSL